MTNADWKYLDDLINDRVELRYGNRIHKSDTWLTKRFMHERMTAHAKYSGHLNWKVVNALVH